MICTNQGSEDFFPPCISFNSNGESFSGRGNFLGTRKVNHECCKDFSDKMVHPGIRSEQTVTNSFQKVLIVIHMFNFFSKYSSCAFRLKFLLLNQKNISPYCKCKVFA